jgi:choline dehydrogenase-like flavoprotein
VLLRKNLKNYFTNIKTINFEVFSDWLPTNDCFVKLSNNIKDKWGDPVAHIRLNGHKRDIEVGEFLAGKALEILNQMGAKNLYSNISSSPPPNLMAGGCRFGKNPKTSVLNAQCRTHEIENLYITDGSWMPTGGSVTHTWTIYANSFRVADIIKKNISFF